ncbi:MAG: erythromycin esterase family protein [Saprospiraceae bacterium]
MLKNLKLGTMKIKTSLLIAVWVITWNCLSAQELSEEQLRFLGNSAVSLGIDSISPSDEFSTVQSEIGNKRMVLIGEFNHGSKEVFLIRNELIKYLHQQAGFDVILFEAGIGELIHPEFNKDQFSPAQLTSGFFGPWRTKEFRGLMQYIKENKLSIAGFDAQRTGRSFETILSAAANDAKLDVETYEDLETQFGTLKSILPNRKIEYNDSLKEQTLKLIDGYEKVYNQLLLSKLSLSLKKSLLILKTIQNRIGFLTYMLEFKIDQDWNKRWAARDSMMADNVKWLAETIYSGKKIIVVGHNFHISKYNEKEQVMGEYLLPHYSNDMYSIGIYAKTGTFLSNYGHEETMKPSDSLNLDIKHIINALKNEVNFLPIPKEKQPGSEWLFQAIITNDTFVDLSNSNTTVLSENYDGLILLQHISTPDK